jgi:ABC transporter substrate binding protein (PQQ-dependent alcohol dehydrogenase system)
LTDRRWIPTGVHRIALGLAAGLALTPFAAAAEEVATGIIRVEGQTPLPLSRLRLPPEDLGLAGAELAIADNNTTGSFMGQEFTLASASVPPEQAVATVEEMIGKGVRYIVTLADAETTLAMADAAGDRALVINARAPDDRLRGEDCRANLLHTAPSRSMLTDALAQYLAVMRWNKWFLIEGSHPEDKDLAEHYKTSAAKFGAKVVEERVYEDTGGARRTDSGTVQVQKQMPVFTQSAAQHDVVIAADENNVFAGYLPYHTWEPRPVAGSAGLEPVSWHAAQEAWGGTQLQSRFEKQSPRPMRAEDWNAWVAIRALGEGATRTNSTEFDRIVEYVEGPDLKLGAFKGDPVSFRSWDGQLRQPIVLVAGDMVVSVSPQEPFVHRISTLDTLGTDEPETTCKNHG